MSHLITEKVDPNQESFLYLNLHEGEEINLIIRHHWGGFLGTLVLVSAMALFPLLVLWISNITFNGNLEEVYSYIIIGTSGYYLFLITFLVLDFCLFSVLKYFNNSCNTI